MGEGFGGAPVFGSGVSVDGEVGEVVEEFGGAVAFWDEFEETRLGVDEFGVGIARTEGGILDHVLEERDVCFHATDTEFAEGAVHALAGGLEVTAGGGELDEHGVVIRSDYGSGVAISGIESDAKAGGGTVVGDATVVGCEAFFGVFGGDPALNGEAVAGNVRLRGDADFRFVKFFALGHEDL